MALDVNAAAREDLVALIGIGEKRADEIIGARPFSSTDDLLSISGIGPRTLERLKAQGLGIGNKHVQEATMADKMQEMPVGDMTRPGEAEPEQEEAYTMPGEEMAMAEDAYATPGEAMAVAGETNIMPGEAMVAAGEAKTMPGETMAVAGETGAMPGESMSVEGEIGTMPGDAMTVAGKTDTAPGKAAAAVEEMQDVELTGTWRLTLSLDSPKKPRQP